MMRAMMERFIEAGNLPPEMREMMTSGMGTAFGIVMGFVAALVAGNATSAIAPYSIDVAASPKLPTLRPPISAPSMRA